MDLDHAGVAQLVLNLDRELASQQDHIFVLDLFGLDDDADLAAGLECKALVDALHAAGQLFQLLQTLDVGFEIFAAFP